jgi:hypothetical protein
MRYEEPEPIIDDGIKKADDALGRPLTLKATGSSNPPDDATEIIYTAPLPRVTVRLDGVAVSVKFGGLVTVRVRVVE